jgi:PKD repeat protein
MQIRYTLFLAAVLAGSLFFAGCDNGGPSGELTASFERVQTGDLSVRFQDRSRNPGGTITARSWDFGDGTTGSGADPSHTYESQGTYTVTLTVEGDGGESASTSREISVGVPGTQQFEVTVTNTGEVLPITKSDRFGFGGPAGPGGEFAFDFTVGPEELPGTGTALSFATMFIQSNDAFFAFAPGGVPLYDGTGSPIGQDGPVDVTDEVALWDAGTEVDQAPGTGSNQPQNGPGGTDEDGQIVQITDRDDDGRLEDPQPSGDPFEYPAVSDVIEVTVESEEDPESGGYEFTVTVANVSDESGATANGEPIALSPGTYAAHFDRVPGGDPAANPEDDVRYPGFIGATDSTASDGLEALAEDGSPDTHFEELDALTGITVPLSPGAFAAHSDAIQLFSLNREASDGLEDIAEDGMPGTLAETLGGADAVTDGDAFGGGPLPPVAEGDTSVTFTVFAAEPTEDSPGDRLSLATMHIQSNDYFYAFDPAGLPLFDESGEPISGDVTGALSLYDANTEQDQENGVGVNQAPRQPGPDTGPSESAPVERLADEFDGNPLLDVIEVTVTPVSQ